MTEGLDKLFPTLMDLKKGGMKYIELKVDPQGQILKTAKPLKVRYYFLVNSFNSQDVFLVEDRQQVATML